jgi:hypothetical protein
LLKEISSVKIDKTLKISMQEIKEILLKIKVFNQPQTTKNFPAKEWSYYQRRRRTILRELEEKPIF